MIKIDLPEGKKVYFASDFHLGAPTDEKSRKREQQIVQWLESIRKDAQHIFLVGDIFDFWYEYKHVIPKGFVRLQGKIAELVDAGIGVTFFTGNHDLWMFDYFSKELGVQVYRDPQEYLIGDKRFLIGHGDGLGPGDPWYKFLKKIFENRFCQWLFSWFHPDLGVGMAKVWSRSSRTTNVKKGEDHFLGDDEWLWHYAKEVHEQSPNDYYIFGHRHLPLNLPVGEEGRYVNLGEWINYFTYGVFDGNKVELKELSAS